MRRTLCLVAACFTLSLQGCSAAAEANYQVESVVEGISLPWGMTWLPNGDMLVSDRSAKLYRVRDGAIAAEIDGLPAVHVNGQGGLLDLALHPRYGASDEFNWLYFSYSDPSGNGKGSNTTLARAKLSDSTLVNLEVLYQAGPNTERGQHYGSRIVFDDAGYLYFSIGDRGARDDNPQDLQRDGGKVYRLHDDGRVPEDNPFVGRSDAIAAVYSFGHRNPQGMARHPQTGAIWAHEHGPRGGDEVNIIKAGANYGWPILSYGINYNGTKFAQGTEREGFESPTWYWDPSIAPSGMTFVTSEHYPDWQGHLLVGSLKFRYLQLVRLNGDQITDTSVLFEGIGRVRDVRQGPDGFIYVATEGEGIKRIVPNRVNASGAH